MDSSPFSMFFQSLLPNFNVQELAAAGPANNADRPAIDPLVRDGNNPADIDGAGNLCRYLLQTVRLYWRCICTGAASNMQSFVELRHSLNSIVDAMRDFLTNIRVPERPNDADVDENESSDDEPNDYLT